MKRQKCRNTRTPNLTAVSRMIAVIDAPFIRAERTRKWRKGLRRLPDRYHRLAVITYRFVFLRRGIPEFGIGRVIAQGLQMPHRTYQRLRTEAIAAIEQANERGGFHRFHRQTHKHNNTKGTRT